MSHGLTQRQSQILNFISSSIDDRGFPPTLREIGEHFGIRSTNGVNDHLKALEKKGYLAREDLKSRAMRPVSRGDLPRAVTADSPHRSVAVSNVIPLRHTGDQVEVQILGRVAAGEPLLAVENVEDTVRIDRFFLGANGDREIFGLRIVGQSMIEDGIHDGDFVFVRKTSTANRGDIVVAMIEGEATVKRYFPEGNTIRFQPANCNMEAILVHRSDFRSVDIIGVVVGSYRKY